MRNTTIMRKTNEQKLQEKNEFLEKEIESLERALEIKNELIKNLSSELEIKNEPIDLNIFISSLPLNDAINVVQRLQVNTFGRAKERLAQIENEKGLIESDLETMKFNAANLAAGKIFKRK